MKKLLLSLLMVTAYGSVWAWDGNGTEDKPYLIKNAADMVTLSEEVNSGTSYQRVFFKVLVSELDFDGVDFTPIGSKSLSFQGSFDGNGVTIKNLVVSTSAESGLFLYVGEHGVVKNVNIEGSCSFTGKKNVGAIAANNQGTIMQCTNEAKIEGEDEIGGIAGLSNGLIDHCVNKGAVTGTESNAGGIVGHCDNVNAIIGYCENFGIITTEKKGNIVGGRLGIGGIIGTLYNGAVKHCINHEDVSGVSFYIGGIAGVNRSGFISDCTNSGNVSGTHNVGGITASVGAQGTIKYCTNEAKIEGEEYIGGIAGSSNGLIDHCVNKGTVTSTDDYVGGIAGLCNDDNVVVSDCENFGTVTSTRNYIGGVVGDFSRGTANHCINHGDVSGDASYIGGVFGRIWSGSASECTNSGSVSGTANVGGITGYASYGVTSFTACNNSGAVYGTGVYVGGIAGGSYVNLVDCHNTGDVTSTANYVGGISGEAPAEGCTNTGKVVGPSCVGGIIGGTDGDIVKNCLNRGVVEGTSVVGGVVGENYRKSLVKECHNYGSLKADSRVGGIVGSNSYSSVVDSCVNTGEIVAVVTDSTGSTVGGIASYNVTGAEVKNCTNSGAVSGYARVGGIVGYSAGGTVTNCENEGTADARSNVAGIVGRCEDSSVSGCTTKGEITGWVFYTGAIIGCKVISNNVFSENFYTRDAIVTVKGTTYSGTTPRGVGESEDVAPYDITEDNGAVLLRTTELVPITTEKEAGLSSLGSESLTDNVIDDIYYNLDGYDSSEQCVTIGAATDMSQVTDKTPGSDDIRNHFTGLILKVGTGSGTITVNAKTSGNAQLAIQIGDKTPTLKTCTEQGDVPVEYDVTEDSYIYIYAVNSTSTAPALRRAASENLVKVYSVKVQPGVTAIPAVTASDQPATIYTLDGRKITDGIESLPKGIYIIGGKKTIVNKQ